MKKAEVVVIWFREDLRLADHPALHAAAEYGTVLPVFVWDPKLSPLRFGAAARWWLHHSLLSLQQSIAEKGGTLLLQKGSADQCLGDIVRNCGATKVFAHEGYDPQSRQEEIAVAAELQRQGCGLQLLRGNTLSDVKTIATGMGTPFRVFTPYWKAACRMDVGKPLPVPKVLWSKDCNEGETIDSLALKAGNPWWKKLESQWMPGESGARAALLKFLRSATGVATYEKGRDRMDQEGTSKLSPHLRFGELSPRQILASCIAEDRSWSHAEGVPAFVRQLYWRDFSRHILWHWPSTVKEPFLPAFQKFPWGRESCAELLAWQKGMTGFPVVDAAMHQLWETGWMHNRARMLVASFLTKDLLLDWRLGRDWFHDCLLDGEPANNTFGWQWTAGCGADGAPFFRIFNPQLQSEKFDPQGVYRKRWNRMPVAQPMLDHAEARVRALELHQKVLRARPLLSSDLD